MKDTLGNDIKQKKYKTVQCALVETVQRKSCRIDGDIEVIQMNPNKVLKKDPDRCTVKFREYFIKGPG